MVACSSVARARLSLYFAESFSFFLSPHFLKRRKPTSRNFPTRRGLVFNRTFAIPISSKCPLKRTGSVKKRTEIHALVWAHPLAHPDIQWHLCRIFGTGEARNLRFGVRIDLGKSHLTSDKIPQKGRGQGPGPNF